MLSTRSDGRISIRSSASNSDNWSDGESEFSKTRIWIGSDRSAAAAKIARRANSGRLRVGMQRVISGTMGRFAFGK